MKRNCHRYPWLALGLLLLLSCHDAPRNNPFDPALTPPVELQVVLDDTAGTATLTWTPYEGQQPFREYRVLRNIADRKNVDTLAYLAVVAQITFVDTTLEPNTAYGYRVAVVNAAGYETPSEERNIAGFSAGPVEWTAVEVDVQQGQAQLQWTRYRGGRFAGYRVERRSGEEEVFGVIARLAGVQDTVYVDERVAPEVSYFYRIVVQAGGQEWVSSPSSRQGFALAPVQLLAATGDPQEGVVRLRWSRFAGPEFGVYQLRRRVLSTDREEVVGEVVKVGDTTLVDGSARAGVDYEYRVRVQAAGQELFSNSRAERLVLPGVELSSPELRAETASVKLKWTPYTGPRFKEYRVERRTTALAPQVVAQIADATITAQVDSGLMGNTEYFYRVVVVTEYGEEMESEEQRGIFHQLLGTWPLDLEEGEYVRLYREGAGITALVAGSSRVRLLFFDTQGARLEEQVLLGNPGLNIESRSVTTSLGLAGQRFLSLNTGRNTTTNWVSVWQFDAAGKSVLQETPVFADTLRHLRGDYTTVQGRIFLDGLGNNFKTISFDNVVVSRGGQVLFAEDFEQGGLGEWDYKGAGAVIAEGKLVSNPTVTIAKTDASWQDFSLEADVVLSGSGGFSTDIRAGIGVGNLGTAKVGTASYFGLFLNQGSKGVVLQWRFTPPEGSVLERQTKSLSEPFPFLANVPYRLGLEAAAGQVHAWVSSPVLWASELDEDSPWASLAGIGESLVLIAGRQSYRINSTQALESNSLLESQVSEVRIWETAGTTARHWMGICLPDRQLLVLTKTAINSRGQLTGLPSLENLDDTVKRLGTGAGQQAGAFLYPLSLDGSPDGRVYVLDAGNGRIQVFDAAGKYLTQWGRSGSGEGEFDFGRGRVPEDFAGSVAVDNEGYIYVADVGNRRIQKFAP